MSTLKKFQDKVVLITGAGRGIGKATALQFAKEGSKVVVNFWKSKKQALEVVEEIRRLSTEAIAIRCDVSDERQVERMVEKTIEAFGRIDVLVNNSGVCHRAPFFERSVKEFKRTVDINLIGVFLCSKYVARFMLSNKSGVIINVSSSNGIDSLNPETMDYDATKAAIDILTRNLARTLSPHIRVNSIAPGWVETDMARDFPRELMVTEKERIFLRRFARPEEIAKGIVFLASEDASYINGSIIKIDGGYE